MKNSNSWFERRLNDKGPPVIIDGGMGTELEKQGVPMDGKVWSGRAVLSHPEAVRNIHEAFIQAGAEVIIANTFAAARHMLEPGGMGEHVETINIDAVRLALEARDNVATGPVAIVGSICEWAPTNDPKWHSASAVKDSCQEQAELLVRAGVDMIALEMCQESDFSISAINAAIDTGLPVWVGVSARTFKGHDTLSVFDYVEQDFESLIRDIAKYPAMIMNVMHTPVPDVDSALEIINRYWNGPVGVYPESGYFEMKLRQFSGQHGEKVLILHAAY